MKHCPKCDTDKPLNAFGKNAHERDGLQRWCRVCRKAHADDPARKARQAEYDRYYRAGDLDTWRAQQPQSDPTVKFCPKCSKTKARTEFGKNKARYDGLQNYCKACAKSIDQARKQTPGQREKAAAKKRERYTPVRVANQAEYERIKAELRAAPTKVCKKCGEEKPKSDYTEDTRYVDGRYPWCSDCRRVWRQKRLPRQRELERQWYERNLDYAREYARNAYHERYKERITPKRRAYDRNRWHTNPDYRAKKNQWKYDQFKTNPVFREKRRLWGRLARQRRRAKEHSVINTLTPQEWREILQEQNYTCPACNRKFNIHLRPTMDHIIPLDNGYGLTKDNCQALCRSCNSRKHTKIIDYRPLKQASFAWGDD